MDYAINIPAVNQSYEYPNAKAGSFKRDMTAALAKIRANYNSELLNASALTGIPASIITAFSVVEDTTVNPNLSSYDGFGSIGLMQVTPSSGAYAIAAEGNYMSPEEKAYVKRFIPSAFNTNGKVKTSLQLTPLIRQPLFNAGFNLYVGALILSRYLVESQKQFGAFRLDHAIIKYNAGIGNFDKYITKKSYGNSDTATVVSVLPITVTRDYILKVMGVDGTLDILKQQGLT